MEADRAKMLAQALDGNMSPSEMRNYGVVNDFDELLPMADRQEDQAWRQQQFSYEKGKDTRDFNYRQGRDAVGDSQWQTQFDANQGWKNQDQENWQSQFGLEKDKWDFTKAQPFEVGGNLVDRQTYKPLYESPASPSTVINNSTGSNETELRKKLSGKEGESWSTMGDAANVSAGVIQDLDVLDELLMMAPQGPVVGRLAQAFPGFSSSGDAANSIMKRVAPSLRTPGSGSTSDIEYDGMLKSLPNLGNTPQGNQIISQIMRAKMQLNVDRGNIVAQYQNGEISEVQARTNLQEINRRSIMTPEMKQLIFGNAQPGGGNDQSGYSLDAVEQELQRRGQQ